jgi:hypothetical protein
VPSAEWETPSIPDQLRQSVPQEPAPAEVIDAHAFFRYVLLLRAMGEQFEEEDGIVWFDDALFLHPSPRNADGCAVQLQALV